LGIYSVSIKLHPKVSSKIKVWVVREWSYYKSTQKKGSICFPFLV
jgi:hypothetical protein